MILQTLMINGSTKEETTNLRKLYGKEIKRHMENKFLEQGATCKYSHVPIGLGRLWVRI